MVIPQRPNIILSKIFPGTAQQFRAQLQRLITRCAEIFGSDIFIDRRLADLTLEPGTLFGLWKSSHDDLLGFREIRQLEDIPSSHEDESSSKQQRPRIDVTPTTRATWSVFMFPRKKRVSLEDGLPEPRPWPVSHVSVVSPDEFEITNEYYEYTEKDQGFACIEAYEQHMGTRIDFIDACDPIGAMDWHLPITEIPIGLAFVEFYEWVVKEIWDEVQTIRLRIHIDDIDSFENVRNVGAERVKDIVINGRLDLKEDCVQVGIENILNVPFHKKDWGGEENDLYTANLVLNGERIPTAFLLKGRGTKKSKLEISDCGKNGDQLIRLFQSPTELFVVQYVGEISENIIKDIDGKTQLLRSQGKRAWYCVLDGQDTARLLRAYDEV